MYLFCFLTNHLLTISTSDKQAALPHGGIRSEDVRTRLEECRYGGTDGSEDANGALKKKIMYPNLFAHELAYVIERSSKGSEEDSLLILKLFLEGVVSLPLAVEYAQRNLPHSSLLWDTLVTYCLNFKDSSSRKTVKTKRESDGKLFGSLLETAARSGADLANLVTKIPKGMKIEGIRFKLVAAISDYQTKLKLHEDAYNVQCDDKVSLIRERCHRSRRGTRIDLQSPAQYIVPDVRDSDDDLFGKIVLRPLKESKDRLTSKRRTRSSREIGSVKRKTRIGITLPNSLKL